MAPRAAHQPRRGVPHLPGRCPAHGRAGRRRQPGRRLVDVGSTAAGNEAYGTSKTALLGLVRALAVALARHAIRVNVLLPGWKLTDLAGPAYASERFRDATTRRTPVRRWADPAEVGPAAVFLADPTTTFHTGDSMVVDGGYTVF